MNDPYDPVMVVGLIGVLSDSNFFSVLEKWSLRATFCLFSFLLRCPQSHEFRILQYHSYELLWEKYEKKRCF